MKIDPMEIMKQIKENNRKLDSCSKHDFSIDVTPDKRLDKRYRCTNCGGEVSWNEKHWYEKGIEHARQTFKTM